MVELILDKPCRVVYNIECYRGVAQLVAHMTGGHGAAGSSPVTPTIPSVLTGLKGFCMTLGFLFVFQLAQAA